MQYRICQTGSTTAPGATVNSLSRVGCAMCKHRIYAYSQHCSTGQLVVYYEKNKEKDEEISRMSLLTATL